MINLARSDNVLLVDDNLIIIIKEIKRLKRVERNLLSDKLIQEVFGRDPLDI